MSNTSYSSKLASGAVWLGAGRALESVLGLAITIILARLLAPEDFGVVALAVSLTEIVTIFTRLHLTRALIQIEEVTDDHVHSAYTLSIIRGVLVTALIVGIAYPFADAYNDAALVPLTWASALVFLIGSLESPKIEIMSRNLVFWQTFALTVVSKLTSLIAIVVFAQFYQNYWAIMVGSIAAVTVRVVLSFIIQPYWPRLTLKKARRLLSFSIWVTLGGIITALNIRMDHFMIGAMLGQSKLGIFDMGWRIANIPTKQAIVPITQTLFPGFSAIARNNKDIAASFRKSQNYLAAIGLPIGIGFAMVADRLVPVALGDKWLGAIPFVEFITVMFAIQTVTVSSNALALGLGKPHLIFYRNLILLAVKLPIMLASLMAYGLYGAIIGVCIANLLESLLNLMLARRLARVSIWEQLKGAGRSGTAVSIMAAVIWGAKLYFATLPEPHNLVIELIALMAIGALVYGAALYALWRVSGRPQGIEAVAVNLIHKYTGITVL